MPVRIAQTMQKRTVRGASACHDGYLVSIACHRAPLAAQPLATRAWKGPQGDTLVDVLERGYRVAACHGKRLAAASALPQSLACRVRKLVAHRALPGLVVRHGKFLEMPWLAFPASSPCRGLVSLA